MVRVWWQEFDVTPRQLEEVSNQMLELYEQNRVPPSQGSEVEGSGGGGASHRASGKVSSANDEQALRQVSPEHPLPDNHGMPARNQSNDNGSAEMGSVITDHKVDIEEKDNHYPEHSAHNDNVREVGNKPKCQTEGVGGGEDQDRIGWDRIGCRGDKRWERRQGWSKTDEIVVIADERSKGEMVDDEASPMVHSHSRKRKGGSAPERQRVKRCTRESFVTPPGFVEQLFFRDIEVVSRDKYLTIYCVLQPTMPNINNYF